MSEPTQANHEAYLAGRADQLAVGQRAVAAAVDQAVETLRHVYPPDWRRTVVEEALHRVTAWHTTPAGNGPAEQGGN